MMNELTVTIRHVGGTRKSYRAKVTQTHLFIYPPLDEPRAFKLSSGAARERLLRDWRVEDDSLAQANALARTVFAEAYKERRAKRP